MIAINGDTAYVFLDGDVDVTAAPAVLEAIHAALAIHVARIVIDLGAVTLLDSSGIKAIVTGYHDAVRAGVGFTIGPAHHRIVPVLEHTGLRDTLTAEPAAKQRPFGSSVASNVD